MIVVERTFTVPAIPAAALGYLADFANTQEWDRAAQHTARIDAGPLVPGARWRQLRRIFGVTAELTYTLVEVAPGRLVFHGRNEGATCTETGDGAAVGAFVVRATRMRRSPFSTSISVTSASERSCATTSRFLATNGPSGAVTPGSSRR